MVDISKYPYFSYNQILDILLEPIKPQTDCQFLTFARTHPNHQKFLVSANKEHSVDYYGSEMYRYGLFEKNPLEYSSGYHMWDHLPHDPNGIYEYARIRYGLAHGLTILQQHDTHLDVFVFATKPGNNQINNFYLNNKDLFGEYIQQFYNTMTPTLEELSHLTFLCLGNTSYGDHPLKTLSPRQQDCALLMAAGLTAKEIAKTLHLSPRTVEEHINILKTKFDAKNRTHLQYMLQKHL